MIFSYPEIKAWCDEHIETFMDEYGIPHWRVTIEYAMDESKPWSGLCKSDARYEHASITLNVPRIESEKTLEKVLRHEFCHILHSPFDLPFQALLTALDEIGDMDPLKAALATMFADAMELTVKNLERMHIGHVEIYQKKEEEISHDL